MNAPAPDRHCPRCFAPLRAGESPEGLCPKCLLAIGMGEDAVIRTNTGAPVQAPPEAADLQPHFEGLDILSLIGRGGGGAVYRATQRDLGRQVALKILLLDPDIDPSFGERFVREARAMASLAHPNIAAVHDAGRSGPYWYLVMEFVDGANLRQLIQSRDLSASDALDVVRQICDALEYAHGEGVVHRDIKPENVLVDRRGRVKLVDFGLAKLLGGDVGGVTLTRSQQAMGTWHYMAPEQLRRPLEVDHRADIYSLGVVLYELLTGEVPQGRYAPVSQRSQADRRIDAIVDRALEQDPERRYQQASGVRDDVNRIQSGPDRAQAPPHAARAAGHSPASEGEPRKRSGCSGCLVGVLVLLGLMLLGFLALMLLAVPYASMEDSTGLEGNLPHEPLPPAAEPLKAALAAAFPGEDIDEAASAVWEIYDAARSEATSWRAVSSVDGPALEVTVEAFPSQRRRAIERVKPWAIEGGGLDEGSAQRLEAALPFGEVNRTFRVRPVGPDSVEILEGDVVLRAAIPTGRYADPLLDPLMQVVGSIESFRLGLDAESRRLESALDKVGTQGPSDRADASGARLDLQLVWPDRAESLPPTVLAAVASIRARYQAAEWAATSEIRSALRAGDKSDGLYGPWVLVPFPPAHAANRTFEVAAFPLERAALEAELGQVLDTLPSPVSEQERAALLHAVLPFGESETLLAWDQLGARRALLAHSLDTGRTTLAWLGEAPDWRVDHWRNGLPLDPENLKEKRGSAKLPRMVLSGLDLAATPPGVVPAGVEVAFPSPGASFLLRSAEPALVSEPGVVAVAEAAWTDYGRLVGLHASWTSLTSRGRIWRQLEVAAFPNERDSWLDRWSGEAASSLESSQAGSVRSALATALEVLPGASSSVELIVSENDQWRVPMAAFANQASVAEMLRAAAAWLKSSEPPIETDVELIYDAWPFQSLVPTLAEQRELVLIHAEYVVLERAHLRAYHGQTARAELRIHFDAFPAERAEIMERVVAFRLSAMRARPDLEPDFGPQGDTIDRFVALGEAPADIYLRFEGPNLVPVHVEGVPSGLMATGRYAFLADRSWLDEAQLFCSPEELGLQTDISSQQRWEIAAARRRYVKAVASHLTEEAEQAPAAPGALTGKRGARRVRAFADERTQILGELLLALGDLALQEEQVEQLGSTLMPFGQVATDLRVTKSGDRYVIEAQRRSGENLAIETVYEGPEPGWRWAPLLEHVAAVPGD